MTIIFAGEYYPPFSPGGAEYTTQLWANALTQRGHQVIVVTPNYGAASRETPSEGLTIRRVPFPIRLTQVRKEARWFWLRNPLFYLYLAGWLVWIGYRMKAEIIHAQGKAALVPSWLAARVLGIAVLFTVRDMGLCCPLGMCPLLDECKHCGRPKAEHPVAA